MSIAMSSMFGNFFICTLIDAMRQVLWVMAFIRPTLMYFAAGAPGGPFPFTDQRPKKASVSRPPPPDCSGRDI